MFKNKHQTASKVATTTAHWPDMFITKNTFVIKLAETQINAKDITNV